MFFSNTLLIKLLIYAIPILFAITVHEVAHGWVAEKFGDTTARRLGRITLNPLKHIDPIGTVIVPLVLLWAGGFIFGWAKPVPVTWHNLRNPKRDMAFVAIAGPVANLLMAFLWGMLSKFMIYPPLLMMAHVGVAVNLVFMILNLIPIPPLDGSRVLVSLLPNSIAYFFHKMEPYGMMILVLLITTGGLNLFLEPILQRLLTWF